MAKRRRRVPQSLKQMDTEHLKCRNLTHPWDPYETEVTSEGRRVVWVIYLECIRCGARTYELYYPTTRERKRAVPSYPDNYLVKGLQKEWGGRKLLNQNVREELWTRIVKGNGRKR